MSSSIVLVIFWHFIVSTSFYAPFKKVQKVRHWSWETMCSLGCFFSWVILPWAISLVLLPDC